MKKFFAEIAAVVVLTVLCALVLHYQFGAPEWAAVGFGTVYGAATVRRAAP